MAASHPAVRFLAVSDCVPEKARDLEKKVGAQFSAPDYEQVIRHPEVGAVIVSTSEDQHADAAVCALELGIPVLVEKPIAMRIKDADRMIAASQASGASLRVGYSRRYLPRYIAIKEQLIQGRLGRVLGGTARVYNSRAQLFEILKRCPTASPVVDILTYYVDLMLWFLDGNPVREVIARGQAGVIKAAGHDSDDVTWAIATLRDGAVVNLGVCYALPAKFPSFGQADRFELIGVDGVIISDNDHKDELMVSEGGVPHFYVPDHTVETVFLNSPTPGEWALGQFWGPLANETRAWLDHLATGAPCHLTTPEEARQNLEIVFAIEESARTGNPILLSG
jgi:predicted dehydrogenase